MKHFTLISICAACIACSPEPVSWESKTKEIRAKQQIEWEKTSKIRENTEVEDSYTSYNEALEIEEKSNSWSAPILDEMRPDHAAVINIAIKELKGGKVFDTPPAFIASCNENSTSVAILPKGQNTGFYDGYRKVIFKAGNSNPVNFKFTAFDGGLVLSDPQSVSLLKSIINETEFKLQFVGQDLIYQTWLFYSGKAEIAFSPLRERCGW